MRMKRFIAFCLMAAVAVQAFAQEKYHIYDFKSAILKTVTTTGEAKSYDTRWIDNYGYQEKSLTTMDMGELGEYKAIILMVGDEAWAINADDEAKKMNARPYIDWRNIPEEFRKSMELKDLGTEEYKGKTCQVYSYKQKQLMTKVNITVWVWQGLIIRQHIKKKLSESWIELESVEIGARIPAGTFDIPKNVKE